jgi:hypothetical protein
MDLLKEHFKAETNIIDLLALSKKIGLKDDPVIIMRDQLDGISKNTKNVVINMARTKEKGTHWVCFHNSGGIIRYFDSFGMIPLIEVVKWAKKNKFSLYHNIIQVQSLNSGFCGEYCLLFIYCMENNISIDHFLHVIRSF